MEDILRLKNMAFYAFHGDDKNEQELGQRYEVDVEMKISSSVAAQEDDLKNTVNYKSVFSIVEKFATNKRYNLIETLAVKIADAILEKFAIPEVSVAVRKLKPPVHGIIDYVEVSLKRQRKSE